MKTTKKRASRARFSHDDVSLCQSLLPIKRRRNKNKFKKSRYNEVDPYNASFMGSTAPYSTPVAMRLSRWVS